MPTFPRTVLPQDIGWPLFPTGLKAFGETGKAQLRATQQVGRTWEERYPPLKMTEVATRAWLAQVEDYWRNQTILDVDHRALRTLLGAGGGTPVVFSPSTVNISDTANNDIVVTTSSAHGFAVGDEVEIASHTRNPSINGLHTVTVVGDTTHFTIPSILGAYVSGGGVTGTVRKRQTGSSVLTSGWPVSTTNVLRAGDVIKLAGLNLVFTVTADVSSDSSGNATIPLNPPLYGGGLTPSPGGGITINNVAGNVKFRAIIDAMNIPRGMGPDIFVGLTLGFREVP